MNSNEVKKKNIIKVVFAIIYTVISCALIIFLITKLQFENALATQQTMQLPKKPPVVKQQPVSKKKKVVPKKKHVKLYCTSVQNDIKIKLLDDKTWEYVDGIPFTAIVIDKNGKKTTYKNKDKKGLIYVDKVKSGKYTVKLEVPKDCVASVDTVTITVKDKIVYKPMPKAEVKKIVSKPPNVKEDTKKHVDVVEKKKDVLKDTVEFVPSTCTKIPEKIIYVSVAYKDIQKPSGVLGATTDIFTTEKTTITTTEEKTTAVNKLFDKSGNQIYIKKDSNYAVAYDNDYNESNQFYRKEIIPATYEYTGWQTIDGKRYYYDKYGKYVTGNHIICGAKYSFDSNGVLKPGYGVLGIDVSKWQGTINWKQVKASGVQFAIIRVGYRGYGSEGTINRDDYYRRNIREATNAGIDVGIYFFSQAIDKEEAAEEAQYCVEMVKGYNLKYPIFIDTETSGGCGSGRADRLSKSQRTIVCDAFCQTIKSAGYTPGIYTSKYWFETKLNMSQLNQYRIWLAQWSDKPTYSGKYDIWQYTSNGDIYGINGRVDMNKSYMTFW